MKMSSLREEISEIILNGNYKECEEYKMTSFELAGKILSKIEKRIDKVEQDYKNELNDWGKKQPMKDMYPKQMDALERVRKELGIKKKK